MGIIDKDLYDSAKHGHKRSGQRDLVKHLEGERLTQREAIRAKCYDCNGMGESDECDIKACSLWPYSPYGGSKKPSTRGVLHAGSGAGSTTSEKDTKDEV